MASATIDAVDSNIPFLLFAAARKNGLEVAWVVSERLFDALSMRLHRRRKELSRKTIAACSFAQTLRNHPVGKAMFVAGYREPVWQSVLERLLKEVNGSRRFFMNAGLSK
jgi:hypothetical protein